jgi:dephospho-CoA kinase
MLRVGLTGGLATGKSFAGQCFVGLGCALLKADELGHRALEPGQPAYGPVVELFGDELLDEEGRIDRRALGNIVFADPDKLARLNAIVHPVVIAAEEAWMGRVERESPGSIAMVEAAILIETGSYKRFEQLVLTVCSEQTQIERAMKRDRLTREEVLSRIGRQMPLAEKRKYASFVIDTSGTKEETLEQVRRVHESLRSLTP